MRDTDKISLATIFTDAFQPDRFDELLSSETDMLKTATGISITVVPEEARGRAQRRGQNTALLLDRLHGFPFYVPPRAGDQVAPNGRFFGHPIIGMGTRVIGGVYMGHKPREAIHVDARDPNGEIRRLYKRFVHRRRTFWYWFWLMTHPKRAIGKNLFVDLMHFVQHELPFSDEVVRRVGAQHHLNKDKIVSLDVYIHARGGVCRHQMCLLGALLELLAEDGYVGGATSINRRHVPGLFSHAWVEHQDSDGSRWIIDPAQNVCEQLSNLDGSRHWFYGGE